METFSRLESEVRSYCRGWPTLFTRARGSRVYDHTGRGYLDFFAGAGALNYKHATISGSACTYAPGTY